MQKLPALVFVSTLLTLAPSAYAGLGLALPAATGSSIQLAGNNTTAIGGIAGESLGGHAIISQNAPGGTNAYYYLMGSESSGVSHSPSYTDTAAATGFSGMGNTASFVSTNSLSAGNLTLRFGPTGTASGTWNLGADTQGVNYYSNGASSIEERIYTASPSAVEAALYFSGVKLITFGYTNLYMIIDYHTSAGNDDTIQAYSDPVTYNPATGLSGTNLGLANALIADFDAGGGLAQLRFDSFQTATRIDASGTLGVTGLFSFSGSVQAIPEPATFSLWAGGLILAASALPRRRRL
ncbi:MAG: hypothetical protein RL376_1426 [Verrucomicrobiota bacterium]